MLNFRKKIFLGDIIVLILFLALLYPVVDKAIDMIVKRAVIYRAERFVTLLKKAHSEAGMIEMLKADPHFANQPVCLLDGEGNLIYRAYTPLIQPVGLVGHEKDSPEVKIAITKGIGFNEAQTPIYWEKFANIAIAFKLSGRSYILHMIIVYYEHGATTVLFEVVFILFIGLMLAFYIGVNQVIIHRFTRSIVQINNAVRAYQEGKEESLPHIILPKSHHGDEFNKLAFTLNSLSARIQSQIENLIRQREETKDILESIGEGIIATDTSAKVTFANRAACRMLGISGDGVIKLTLDEIEAAHIDLAKKCHEMILHALQTSESMVQTWTLHSGGSLYLNLISAPLAHQDGALLVLQDVTSDYKVIEMGKDFIANASHELRTPITIIRGFAETLQDLPDLSQEMLRDITEKIVRTCGRLDKLVRSLLTLADIENLSQDRFNVANLVLLAENSKHNLLAAHPHVQITLKSKCEFVPIYADTDLLELAILNLLENAVKYSQGTPEIEMSILQMEDEVGLRIQDHGIGISDADLPHIFERFYTVDKARSRKSGGAGLGLSIVKTIIEKHNGRVAVSSQFGKGSTFILTLPLKKN